MPIQDPRYMQADGQIDTVRVAVDTGAAIIDRLDRLELVTARVEDTLNMLGDRLHQVLRPDPQVADVRPDSDGTCPVSPVASRLDLAIKRLSNACDGLDLLRNRVEC